MTADIETIARDALAALDHVRPIKPFTARYPDFDIDQAYAVVAAANTMRMARGERPVGRKIGFTNRDMWAQYRIDRPVWGYVYDHTALPIAAAEVVKTAQFCEPKLEPEIVLRLSQTPAAGMDERAILDCVEWVAHGFEIVQSIFPGWRFKVPDTIADFGLHGALRIGEPVVVTARNREALFAELKSFTVILSRGNEVIETGRGTNVLDGPLSALRHLVDVLAADPHNPPLAAGEIVTTGTLTRAYPVSPGETWSTTLSGIPLPGLSIRFG
ncbi:MAG: 2-keto-4-pentenoate hydratase [Pseudomonadota bacterium]